MLLLFFNSTDTGYSGNQISATYTLGSERIPVPGHISASLQIQVSAKFKRSRKPSCFQSVLDLCFVFPFAFGNFHYNIYITGRLFAQYEIPKLS